jgi:hypothetical protein
MMNLFSRFNERGVLVHRASACLPRFFFFYLVRIAYRHAHPHAARQHDATAIHAAIARNEVTCGVVPRETPHVATDLGASQTAQSHGGMNVALDLSTLQN